MSSQESVKTGPILAAIDFSECSEAALAWAASLASRTDTPLTVVHVVHDPAHAPGYYSKAPRAGNQLVPLEDAAKEMMDEFLAEASERVPALARVTDLRTLLVVGIPATRIVEVAQEIDASQIVMGSQGRTGLSHLLLGSKAEQVVRLSPLPVTIVKV